MLPAKVQHPPCLSKTDGGFRARTPDGSFLVIPPIHGWNRAVVATVWHPAMFDEIIENRFKRQGFLAILQQAVPENNQQRWVECRVLLAKMQGQTPDLMAAG